MPVVAIIRRVALDPVAVCPGIQLTGEGVVTSGTHEQSHRREYEEIKDGHDHMGDQPADRINRRHPTPVDDRTRPGQESIDGYEEEASGRDRVTCHG